MAVKLHGLPVSITPVELLATAVGIFILFYLSTTSRKSQRPPLPPGPLGLPIFGNMFSIPKSHIWRYFDEQCKRHGPLISLKFANQTFIVAGNYKVAHELLVKRSSHNASRPPSYAFDLMAKGRRFIFLRDDNPGWRVARRMLSQVMSEVRLGRMVRLSEFECKYTMQRIMKNPEDWKAQFQRFAGSSILGATYGIHVEVENTAELRRLHERAKRTNVLANPRAFIVNAFPFLDKILPDSLAPWRKLVNEVEKESSLFSELFDVGMEKGRKGIENWTWRFYNSRDLPNLKETSVTLPFIAGEIFGAGVNTTWISLQNFVLASLVFPEAFVAAKDEIDKVIGSERLPVFADRPSMPQMEAVYREILRWRVAVPHGLYHEQTVDDILEVNGKSYLVPAGAVVIGNIYSIEHDPEEYPDPFTFNPQRHLNADLTLKADRTSAFGFGRRICVGQPFAEKSIWIMITHMMWLFNVERSPGDTSVIDPFAETGSATAHPLPFRAYLRTKSEMHAALAKQDYEEYDKNLEHLMK